MSAVLEARAVIVGQDKTKAAFDSVEARISKLVSRIAAIDSVMSRVAQISGPVAKTTAEVERFEHIAETMRRVDRQVETVRRSFAETAVAIDKATAAATRFGRTRLAEGGSGASGGVRIGGGRGGHASGRHGLFREALGSVAPLVGLGVVYEGVEAVRGAVHGGFERQHERTRMATSGMSPREIGETEGLSADLAAHYPSVSQVDIMHLMRNARSVVGSYEEASKILQPLLDLRVVAQGAHPGEGLEEDFDKLIKGMEIKGVTQDPEKFRSYINSMGKAVNAFGDTLKPTDFYEMFKYGRQSTTGFSQDYMMQVAPTIAQEMGGNSAGVANSAFFSAVVGGHMTKAALARLTDLGLVDKSKVITPKGGHIASAAGAIEGTLLAQANPYEWVNKILLPAMAKKGIVDPDKIQEVINSVFSNKMAAQLVGIYATQQARIEKDRGVIAGTMDTPEAAKRFMETDPIIAAEGLKNAVEGLASTFADKELHLASAMTSVAQAVNRFNADLIKAHDRQDGGVPGPEPVLPGQRKFNEIANLVNDLLHGREPGGSKGDIEQGARASQIETGRRRAIEAADWDYQSYEDSRNAGIMQHGWETRRGRRFPLDRVQVLEGEGELSVLARQDREKARAGREAGDLADKLDAIDRTMAAYDNGLFHRYSTSPPKVSPDIGIGGLGAFPMGRSYADLPTGDLIPGLGGHGAPGAPQVEEHHALTADDLKTALGTGGFTATLDPSSKASVDVTVKVEPSSELLRAVEAARSVSASGNLTAGSSGVSTPTQPYRGPAGIGRM